MLTQSESEIGLISCVLKGNEIYDSVVGLGITEKHFQNAICQEIFKICNRIVPLGIEINMLSVANEYKGEDNNFIIELNSIDGKCETATQWRMFAKNVLEFRKIYEIESAFLQFREDKDILSLEEAVSKVSSTLLDAMENTMESTTSVDDLKAYLAKIQERIEHKGKNGLHLGMKAIDEQIPEEGDLIIIGALSGAGKSAFMIDLVARCLKANVNVLIFSCEMSKIKLFDRLVANYSNINSHALKDGRITIMQEDDFKKATKYLETKWQSWEIKESAGYNIQKVEATIRSFTRRRKGLNVVFVDYVQLLKSSERRNMNREQQVAEVARGLKVVAQQTKTIIIALSQVNKDCEQGDNPRPPQAKDLRDSQEIRHAADLIYTLFAPIEYKMSPTAIVDVITAKAREGGEALNKMNYDKRYSQFTDII